MTVFLLQINSQTNQNVYCILLVPWFSTIYKYVKWIAHCNLWCTGVLYNAMWIMPGIIDWVIPKVVLNSCLVNRSEWDFEVSLLWVGMLTLASAESLLFFLKMATLVCSCLTVPSWYLHFWHEVPFFGAEEGYLFTWGQKCHRAWDWGGRGWGLLLRLCIFYLHGITNTDYSFWGTYMYM